MIVLSDLGQAFGNLRAQKTRTLLTALGIVFGVGSSVALVIVKALPLVLLVPFAGIALLFSRRVRGYGLGLLLALPTDALIIIGICSGFHF